MTVPKPSYGQPCNGCGACCRWTLCPLAEHVYGKDPGPCPALVSEDGGETFGCGLILDPLRFAPARSEFPAQALTDGAQALTGAGMGCDAADRFEPRPPMVQDMLRRRAAALPKWRIRAAMRAWGFGEHR